MDSSEEEGRRKEDEFRKGVQFPGRLEVPDGGGATAGRGQEKSGENGQGEITHLRRQETHCRGIQVTAYAIVLLRSPQDRRVWQL